MRLLDTYTGRFVEKDPTNADTKYAILSHTWDSEGEQTYKELKKIQKRHPLHTRSLFRPSGPSTQLHVSSIWKDSGLSPKIRDACAYARADGFRYIWIDSCCIDKTSSSELSEAINSMYTWYGRADVCYAFLADVPTNEDHAADGSRFRKSRWFTRGWTLQELLAPPHLVFLSETWTPLGSKLALVELVHRTTNISPEALLEPGALDRFSVAQRLSWAAKRETTRAEDRAYSLLGIFDINMPVLYGEGERAFRRLQEEILRRIPDQTLFAWLDVRRAIFPQPIPSEPAPVPVSATTTPTPSTANRDGEIWVCQETQPRHVQSLLALSPNRFADGGQLTAIPHDEVFQRLPGARLRLPPPDYTFTPLGIRTQLPVIPFSLILPQGVTNAPGPLSPSQCCVVILGCEHKDFPGCLLGRVCCIPPSQSGVEFVYDGSVEISSASSTDLEIDLFPLSPATIERCAPHIELRAVYICHARRPRAVLDGARNRPHEQLTLLLSEESRSALRRLGGYTAASLEGPDATHPRTHRLALANARHTLKIACQHTLENGGKRLVVKVDVRVVQGRAGDAGAGEAGVRIQRTDAKTLGWTDSVPWAPMLWNSKGVALDAGEGARLTVKLHLDFVVTNRYVLHVEVQND